MDFQEACDPVLPILSVFDVPTMKQMQEVDKSVSQTSQGFITLNVITIRLGPFSDVFTLQLCIYIDTC